MEISYLAVVIGLFLIIALIILLIKKNKKDKVDYEEQENLIKKPEKHKGTDFV